MNNSVKQVFQNKTKIPLAIISSCLEPNLFCISCVLQNKIWSSFIVNPQNSLGIMITPVTISHFTEMQHKDYAL